MQEFCFVTYPGQEAVPELQKVSALPDLLKAHPEGLYRSRYFFAEAEAADIQAMAAENTLPLSGPFLVVHAIRRARDIIMEFCDYEGVTVQLEVQGKRLPELPPAQELEALLEEDTTLIIVNDRPYKARTEVFGFQNVYDDTVRFIDGLKKMGIPQETLSILATPDEIAIEVHPSVFGIEDEPDLARLYHNLTCHLGTVKAGDRRLLKNMDRTVILSSNHFQSSVLLPGSIHPSLHRPKVGVGPSHFAYGPAAFSDYCGKKRTLDECVTELKTWVKFVQTQIPPIEKAKEALLGLPNIEVARSSAAAGAAPSTHRTSGGFQSFKADLTEQVEILSSSATLIPTAMNELNKCLGGGWKRKSLNILTGSRESGKAAFLMQQAAALADKHGVLYLSWEHTLAEFACRTTARMFRQPLSDILGKKAVAGPTGDVARQKYAKMLGEISAKLSENLFFRGSESMLDLLDLDQVGELVKMIPDEHEKFLILESVPESILHENPLWLSSLRQLAQKLEIIVILSVHTAAEALARPHLIDAVDLPVLAICQREADTVLNFTSERTNLKKFIAMTKGKVEPALVTKLEQGFLKAAGGARFKSDTYVMIRSLHSRHGIRQATIYYYQRDLVRFFEGPSVILNRP